MRKTKIVATVGPACEAHEKLTALISAGADMLRINASHSSPKGIRQWIRRIRKAEAAARKTVSILVDLQGPRVRTGKLENKRPVSLRAGEKITLSITSKPGSENHITTTCKEFTRMVKPGDNILLDNGLMELDVLSVKRDTVFCKVLIGGTLGENKGINLPHAPVTLPALSEKDKKDLKAAVMAGVDYVALSFVRSEHDLHVIKAWLKRAGKSVPVIAKIEKPQAVHKIIPILKQAEGVMVARGDLGIEMGVEKVPFIQKEIINDANRLRIPVITATQMLESMIENARPTRAEASDIANAVYDGTDAVMLSGETSIGKYPVEAVKMMVKIILDAEKHIGESVIAAHVGAGSDEDEVSIRAIVHAARHAAKDLNAKAIVVFTRGGKTAMLISKFHPLSPVIALVDTEATCRKLTICRGVEPVRIRHTKNTDAMIRESDRVLSHFGFVKKGDAVVILSGRQALPASRYMTKIHRVGELAS